MDLKEVKDFLNSVIQENIRFDSHFYKRTSERPINEGMVRGFFGKLDKLEKIELGKSNNRFKLWFKMSTKYSLVVIIEINLTSKDLKVISAWNSDRKWQSKLRQ